jgi:uncharacterized protein YndB with AHSA1/START domain
LRHAILLYILVLAALPDAAGAAESAGQAPVIVKATKIDDKIALDAQFTVQAPAQAVWNVLTDYDHMASFLPSLEQSKVVSREGNRWEVSQKGKQTYGFFSFPFDNLREVRVTPFTTIESHLIRGTLRLSDGLTRLIDKGGTTDVVYHGEFVPNISFPAGLGMGAVESETRKQFEQLRSEVDRRKAKGE